MLALINLSHSFHAHHFSHFLQLSNIDTLNGDECGIKSVPLIFGSSFCLSKVTGRAWRKFISSKFFRKRCCHMPTGPVKYANVVSGFAYSSGFTYFQKLEMK